VLHDVMVITRSDDFTVVFVPPYPCRPCHPRSFVTTDSTDVFLAVLNLLSVSSVVKK
jgi:hypothetical protein